MAPSRPSVAPLAAVVALDTLGYGLVVPLLPLAVARLGGGATEVGLLFAMYAVAQAVCGPLLGALSDRVGRRPVLLACLAGSALAYAALAAAGSLPALAAALLLDAVTGANLSVAQASAADRATDETRARDLGALGVAFGLGVTAGPALGGALAGLGPAAAPLGGCALALANLAVCALALPESLPAERRARGAWRPAGALDGLRGAAAQLWPLLLAVLLTNLAFSGLQSNFPLYSRERFGWGPQANGALFAFVGLCAVLTQGLLLGLLRRRASERALAAAGAAAMALAIPPVGLATEAWALYPLAAAAAVGSSLALPSLTAALAARAGPSGAGRAMGAQQVAVNAALAAGPLLAGLAYDRAGPWAPYALGGAAAALAAAALLLRPSEGPRLDAHHHR